MICVDEIFTIDPMLFKDDNPLAGQAARHGKRWCHMWSDSDDVEELVSFALKLGLKREYFQNGSLPHFDLTSSKRNLAIKLGAEAKSLKSYFKERMST